MISAPMAQQETIFEARAARPYPVVLLVSAVDRRILPALRFVSRLPFAEIRALHVSVDPDATRQIVRAWMELGLAWLPLFIREDSEGGIAATIKSALDEEAAGAPTVTLVVPELNITRWWHPLLHRQTARHLAAELQSVPRLTTVIVPFALTATSIQGR